MNRKRLAGWAEKDWYLWLAAVLCGVASLAWSLTAPTPAYAIALDATAWGDQGTAKTTVTTAAFSTTSGNELLLAFISADSASGPNTTATSVSGAGLTWVLVRRTNVQLGTAEIWRAFTPAVLTNVTVTATLSQSVASSLTVVSFSGVDPSGTNGSGAIGATGTGNAARGAPTTSITTTRNNSWVFGVGADWDNPIARTPGANQTLVHQYMPPVGDTYWVQRLNAPTPTAGTSVTLNDTAPTGDRYNLSLVEVLPALGPSYSLTGTLSPAASGSGATVTLSGAASATTTADANGNFSFGTLASGTYTVTPSKSGFTFTPPSQTVTVTGANVTGVNFTAVVQTQTWSITGTLSPAASGSGATVTLSGAASATTTADANGNFSFGTLASGTYTVTPSKSGFTFTPPSQGVTVNGANVTGVSFSTQAQTCPCTIWSPSNTPTVVSYRDWSAVEIGVKFRANVNGSITGIRFYKGAANTGTHVGNLWTSTGTRLATATFTNEAASGWQQATFASPVAITANTTYVASYHTNVGRYARDNNYFASAGVTRGPLTALANGVDGGNGVYRYGATSAFPNQTRQSSNYWVDVVFTTSGGGAPDTTPPTVIGWTPASGATDVAVGTTVTATFSEALTPSTVTTSTFTLQGPGTTPVPATVSYNSTTFTATLTPTSSLTVGTLYTVTLKGGTTAPQIKDVAGNALTATLSWSFRTVAVQAWSITGTLSPAASGRGATVTLSGAASATTTADANGDFSFGTLANGTYTVTPSKSGFTFSPPSQTVTVTGANVNGVNFATLAISLNLRIDGSQTFQTVDGMGVNIHVNNWNGGQLAPALDLLVDTNGSSVLRVIRDPMDWVSSEALIPALHALNPTTLQQVYEAPKMQDIWSTIGYLNQKGLGGNQIVLNFMGWTPTWLGGSGAYGRPSYITAGKESEFATMVASLVYYGRRVKNLQFTLLAPLNEPDLNCLEGPCVGASQYGTILNELIAELDFMGLNDVRLVGPDTASNPGPYISSMMADRIIAGRVDHLGEHTYSGSPTPGTPYPPRNYWMTETAAWCSTCDTGGTAPDEWAFARLTNDYILNDLANGFSGVLVWEGYDSFYYHHNSWSFWGLLAYDQTTGVYAPRKRFYVNAQVNRFIRPGAAVIADNSSVGSLIVVAFFNPISGQVTIVGHNTGSSAITLNAQLQNLPAVSSLAIYETNASVNLQRGPDVPVIGGVFAVTIPADTFFSLTN